MARSDPEALLLGRDRVTLDEVQRVPDLLLAVKRAVDAHRRPGRFLLTGSANLLLMRRVSETLAGRAVYCQLPVLTWSEAEGRGFGVTLGRLLRGTSLEAVLGSLRSSSPPRLEVPEAVLAGEGYPEPTLHANPSFRARWHDGYVQTYLERDLRDLSATDSLVDFRRLMQVAASQNGRLVNVASMARDAGLSPATARRYPGHLEVSFQVMRVPAYAVNRGKRLIKAPRLFWSDNGLAAHAAGIFDVESPHRGREWDLWLENWVGPHLAAYAGLQVPRVALCHWRTAAGQEVDSVLEAGRRLLPIEDLLLV